MLKIAFFDPIHWDYVIDTPRVKPLGGSQSALCYLAEELAKLGHDVTLINETKSPGRSRGVGCFNIAQVPLSQYLRYDVVIILNSGSQQIAGQIRGGAGKKTTIILWSQHNHDQAAVQELATQSAHDAWDEFVLVSAWQAKGYRDIFGVRPERIKIIGNAISPVFENLYPGSDSIAVQKPWPPVLCYTSTPFRGLDVLIKAFPRIRAGIPGTTLKVYSSMAVYGVAADQDEYRPLYERCLATEGIDYVGSLPQAALAQELKNATCLAYPNTFAEGYCISVLEAMAAGCIVITSDLGALRYTTAGFGHLLTPHPDKKRHAEMFADFAVKVLEDFRSSPMEQAQWLKNQVRLVNQTGTWAVRAREWDEWLSSVVATNAARATTTPELLSLALQHHQAGRLQEAEVLYRRILQEHPNHPDALHLLGLIAHHVGRHTDALELIGKAIAINPGVAEFHYSIGDVSRAQGNWDTAIAHYRRAIALNPAHEGAYINLGNTLNDRGKTEEAAAHYRQAIALMPTSAKAWFNLGNILKGQGKMEEALAVYRQAVLLDPLFAEAHNNLGGLLQYLGHLDEAVVHYRQALERQPAFAEAGCNLGLVLREQGKLEEAVVHLQRAVAIKPDYADAYNNLGLALQDVGRLEEAVAHFRRALAINPDSDKIHSNLLFALHYQPTQEPAALFACHREWNGKHARPLTAKIVPHANPRVADRRLRIGYVSADFQGHPVGYFIKPIVARHDKTRVKVFCYSMVGKEDAVTASLRSSADEWRSITGLSDDEVADVIRRDGIDILVDLSGHTSRNRLLVFARKPAPVQAAWIGYADTTGLDTMDYLIADHYVSPPNGAQPFTEKLVELPGCYLCYEPPDYAPPVSPLPALSGRRVTFGCFNNLAKVNTDVIAVWAKILQRVRNARLVLKTRSLNDQQTRERLLRCFTDHGIASERVELLGSSPHPDLLAAYGRIDIALDPFPYTGGFSTCEALWMGAPVITLQGATFLSRIGASLLSRTGLSETIASSPEHYAAIAVRLSKDLDYLASLRSGLRARMAASLCDAATLTHHVERAYRMMWDIYARGETPRSLVVPEGAESARC